MGILEKYNTALYHRNSAIGATISPEIKSQSGNTDNFQDQMDGPFSGLLAKILLGVIHKPCGHGREEEG